MSIMKKRITEACYDIVLAIREKNLYQLVDFYPITAFVGKLALILNNIRCHEGKIKIITKDLMIKHLSYLNLTWGGADQDIIFLEQTGAIQKQSESDNEYKVLVSDINNVYDLCSNHFNKQVAENKNSNDFKIVAILTNLITPQTLDILKKNFADNEDVEDHCEILKSLGLVQHIPEENIYYNTKFFGENKKKVCDLLSENKSIPKEVLDIVNKVHDVPGIPSEDFEILNNLKKQETIKANAILGVLDPVSVQVGELSKVFLFPPNIKEDNKLSLPKESTAFFRFNQVYADKELGRLDRLLIPTIRKLIREGVAGSADNIALNYKPIEQKGVFKVQNLGFYGRPAMVLQKKDVMQDVLSLIEGEYGYNKPTTFKRSIKDLIRNPTEQRANLKVVDEILKKNKENILRTIRDGGMR